MFYLRMKEFNFYKNLFKNFLVKKNSDLKQNKHLFKTNIQKSVNYILNQKSKRIRPVLMLMFFDLYSDKYKECMPSALSIELLHNFTLVHDDIMDNAKIRRSQKTINEKWNNNVAILTGDFLFNESLSVLQEIKDPVKFKNIVQIINKSLFELCVGQDQDMLFEKLQEVSTNDYFTMIYNKTSSLIKSSILIGSYMGGADETEIKEIEKIGVSLGSIFQLKDDFLDIYGENKFGKKIYEDIINNKKTFFYVKAQELGSAKDSEDLRKLYSSNFRDSQKKINQVLSIYNKLNLKNILNEKLEYEYQIIQQKILDLKSENKITKDIILNYVRFLIGRDV